jgi:hypothetical protein
LLCEQRGIKQENLYFWDILMQLYKTSFVRLKELRFFPSTQPYSNQNSRASTIVGTDLATRLFQLMSSGARKNREKYGRIKKEFGDLTHSEFEVVIREKEVEVASEGAIGVIAPQNNYTISNNSDFIPIGYKNETRKRLVNEASIQVIKDNYPIPIEETASGLYEILVILTAIIGENKKILLLDEPELHLHPTMQKRILNLISESKTADENQILLITHSPYFTSAEDAKTTWRFSMPTDGTKVHNVGEVLSNLEKQIQEKIAVKLTSPDIRSILFSRGVILVEGPSDRIVIEQIP